MLIALFLANVFFPGCSNNAPSEPKQTPPASAPAPMPTPASKPSTAGKLNIDLTEDPAAAVPKPAAAPQPAYQPPPPPEGPSGYVSRKNVVLQTNPTDKAPVLGQFQLYEEVIILEVLSKDEQGKETEVPTWYKVKRKDKKVGWVVARSVTVN